MIYLLYGEDDFSRDEFLAPLKAAIEPADLRDVNTSTLEGSDLGFAELVHGCDTVPFLAAKRLVIVLSLLSRFERRAPSRGRTAGESRQARALGDWEGLGDYLSRVPESTDLVFIGGRLSPSNPLLAAIRPRATTRTFPPLKSGELRSWIRRRAAERGVEIETRAVDSLATAVGSDLRVIAGELEKLSLYRTGDVIGHEDVERLVSYTREANIFATVDAMMEGKAAVAVRMVHALMQAGRPPAYILSMVARQVRLLILAKALSAQQVPFADMGQRLGLSGYPLRKTLDQERMLSAQRLVEVHGMLLEADLDTKSLGVSEELILDTLIVEIASGRAKATSRASRQR